MEKNEPTILTPALADLQKWIQSAISHPEGIDAALESLAHQPGENLFSCIVNQPFLAPCDRLAIYGEGYFIRLIDCLRGDFDTLLRAVGEEKFQSICRYYLVEHPSQTPIINEVGRYLPEYLKNHSQFSDTPYLSDLAAMDWAALSAFLATDSEMVDVSSLAQVTEADWAEATFELAPSVQAIQSHWALHSAWLSELTGAQLVELLNSQPAHVLVYRKNEMVYAHDIGEMAFAMLDLIRQEYSLGELTQKIATQFAQETSAIQECFAQSFGPWIAEGIIEKINFK